MHRPPLRLRSRRERRRPSGYPRRGASPQTYRDINDAILEWTKIMTFEHEFKPYITEEGRAYYRQLLARDPATLSEEEADKVAVLRFLIEQEEREMN